MYLEGRGFKALSRSICIEQINVIIGAIQSAILRVLDREGGWEDGRSMERRISSFTVQLITEDKMLILCSFDLDFGDENWYQFIVLCVNKDYVFNLLGLLNIYL